MSVSVGEICEALERLAPIDLAENWDNVGLLVGRRSSQIDKALVALDVTDDVVDEAISIGATLIISHHPLIFTPIPNINDENHLGGKLLKIIENRINIYAAHTNLDIAEGGTNDVFAERLELDKIEDIISDDKGENCIGRAGYLKQPMKLKQLAELIKEKLSLDTVRVVGDGDNIVGKVGICTGSGAKNSYFEQVKTAGCDVYVTGDIGYHQAQTALDCGLSLIDATHYASEVMVVDRLCKYIENEFAGKDVLIFPSKINGQVFNNI